MFDVENLDPSHKPMRAAADLANASVCLRAAEGFAQAAMRALQESYGHSLDVRIIGELAARFDQLNAEIMRIETETPADLAERLRRARAL